MGLGITIPSSDNISFTHSNSKLECVTASLDFFNFMPPMCYQDKPRNPFDYGNGKCHQSNRHYNSRDCEIRNWTSKGDDINCESLLKTYRISEQVKVIYCNYPTTLLNSLGLSIILRTNLDWQSLG